MRLEGIESVPPSREFVEFDEIIDVRSPLEFDEDHVPGAINLPVLSNEQREEIGLLHRRAPFQAQRLGAAHVSANIARHLTGELELRHKHWNPLVYCWRGGQRSRAFATVLRAVGWRARIIDGGYKAWRRFVREDLDALLDRPLLRFHVLAGLTGSGKSHLLATLHDAGAQVLDLEGLANHRGSILGTVGPQPSQKRFESLLHEALATVDPSRPVFVEAESNRIGRVQLPGTLWHRLREGIVYHISLPPEERVRHLLDHYPHFRGQPDDLKEKLDGLRRLRGHAVVEQWMAHIDAGRWDEFVRAILDDHYDLVYRRPGSERSVYQPPTRFIEMRNASPDGLAAAAAQILSHTEALVHR